MTNNSKVTEMYIQYKKGYSLSEVGQMFGITRQSVYECFRRREFKLRKLKKLPFLTFNGVKFTLRNHGYYARTDEDRELMHRYVWIFYNGFIPKGFDVHHVDGDRSNNSIDNLNLIEHTEHAKKYFGKELKCK